nr:uncharacterized protein LOC117280915 [Nicotiana tomentosiformis]
MGIDYNVWNNPLSCKRKVLVRFQKSKDTLLSVHAGERLQDMENEPAPEYTRILESMKGYNPLPPHDPIYSYIGPSSHQSQSHVVIRTSSAQFASSPSRSHPFRFQLAGSQQGSRSQQGCGSQSSSSTTLSPSPRSSSPSISRLCLRDSSAELDVSSSAHVSDSSEEDDPGEVRIEAKMPSGAKKRRAARRKQQEEAQTKQADDLTTVSIVNLSIPIEKLAKGVVLHEATSVETKVATVDDNAIEENEVPLLNIISNEDNVVSQNAGCIIKTTESGENLKENESLGVVCVDTKETEMKESQLVPGVSNDSKEIELLKGEPEEIVEKDDDLLSPEEMWEKYHDLLSETDTTILDYDKNRGFFLREAELPVVVAQPTSNEDVKEITPNSAENTVCSSAKTQAVSTITVSPATKNQAHFSSPVPCNLECIAIKESIENLMARVGEFGSSMHTFKEDLQKTLDKLNANSF